jgi:hypothetical protein
MHLGRVRSVIFPRRFGPYVISFLALPEFILRP